MHLYIVNFIQAFCIMNENTDIIVKYFPMCYGVVINGIMMMSLALREVIPLNSRRHDSNENSGTQCDFPSEPGTHFIYRV